MRKTKKEIIDETVAFYEEDPTRRALDNHGLKCQYITADGRNCAVGRCLTDEVLEEIENSCGNLNFMGVGPLMKHNDRGDSMFREEYRGHGVSFWVALQTFHDGVSYWNTVTTATSAGERARYVTKLHAEWDNVPGLEEQS